MHDFRAKFLFENLAIRGELVRLEDTLRNVLARHDYPAPLPDLLGEALAAAALLTGTLKFEGLLVLQARGDGPLRVLMAECSDRGNLRAIARYDAPLPQAPLVHLLGSGHLAITIDPEQGQRYQGIVPLDGISLGECLEHYFQQSEQLPTRLWLLTGQGRAAGLLLQQLPATEGVADDPDAWNRLGRLADTLTGEELLALDTRTLLHRLFHEEDVRLFADEPLQFLCSCSRERAAHALRSVPPEELRALVAEQGKIEITCQFCNERRLFDAVDVEEIARQGPAG